MSKRGAQIFGLTEPQLHRLVGHGTYPGAQAAWNRADEIRNKGGAPVIYYSEHNGFTVIDEKDASDFQRARSFARTSKPFPL